MATEGMRTDFLDIFASGDKARLALVLSELKSPNIVDEDSALPLILLFVTFGDVLDVELLLKSGADPNVSDSDGESPLMRAAVLGRSCIARLLLVYGANVDAADQDGITSSMIAAKNGDTALLKTLDEFCPNWDAIDSCDRGVLHWACTNGDDKAIFQFLLDRVQSFNESCSFKLVQYARSMDCKSLLALLNSE